MWLASSFDKTTLRLYYNCMKSFQCHMISTFSKTWRLWFTYKRRRFHSLKVVESNDTKIVYRVLPSGNALCINDRITVYMWLAIVQDKATFRHYHKCGRSFQNHIVPFFSQNGSSILPRKHGGSFFEEQIKRYDTKYL